MTNSPTTLTQYEAIAALTENMANQARNNEWDQVIELSHDYIAAIDLLKQSPPLDANDTDNEAKQNLITRILADDAEIRDLAAPELERLGGLLGTVKRQQDVVQAYCKPSMTS